MKIALFGLKTTPQDLPVLRAVIREANHHNISLTTYSPLAAQLRQHLPLEEQLQLNATYTSHQDLQPQQPDIMVSVGGDGTLLDTTTLIRHSQIPALGINTGRLGFLANIPNSQVSEAITALATHNYTIDNRLMLQLTTTSPQNPTPQPIFPTGFALNEVVIRRTEQSPLISITVHQNDEFLNTYWADGLIIATPTGSTAYSLSCGGPIILPHSQTLLLTPMASHSLTVRPMIIPATASLRITVESRSGNFIIAQDSNTTTLPDTTTLHIARNPFDMPLVQIPNHTPLTTIRHKLFWGIDNRTTTNTNE